MAVVALIAAAAGKNQVIGRDGAMPWHLPADFKYFKRITLGHPVLMGRATYDSILQQLGKPLPQRRNLVLTRDLDWQDDRVAVFHDLEAALASVGADDTLFVIGGGQLYRQTLGLAQHVYLTHIDAEIAGDTFFPPLDPALWRQSQCEHLVDQGLPLRFCRYDAVIPPTAVVA
jgi:dihydrofolate reductase